MMRVRVTPVCKCGNDVGEMAPSGIYAICIGCGEWRRLLPQIQFSAQDDLFMRAVELGCTPVWTGLLWECRCPNATHGVSLGYPALTLTALERAAATL